MILSDASIRRILLMLGLLLMAIVSFSCGGKSPADKTSYVKRSVTADGRISTDINSMAVGFKLYCKYPYYFNSAQAKAPIGVISCSQVNPLDGSVEPMYVEPIAHRCEIQTPQDFFTTETTPALAAKFACQAQNSAGKYISLDNTFEYNCVDRLPWTIAAYLNRQDVDTQSALEKYGLTIDDLGYFEISIPASTGFNCLGGTMGNYKEDGGAEDRKATDLNPTYIGNLDPTLHHACLTVKLADNVTDDNGNALPAIYYSKERIIFRIRAVNRCY